MQAAFQVLNVGSGGAAPPPPAGASIVAYFTGSATGGAPGVSITFDASASAISNCGGSPTYLWEYKLSSSGTWLTMSTLAGPSFVFAVAGVYDVRVTITCGAVSNTHTKPSYISIVAVGAGKFISVLGNDANPGTLAAPWRTFGWAKTQMAPGQTLYVLGNDGIFNTVVNGTSNEFVRWDVPGTAGNPITIQAYPGHNWRMDSENFKFPNTTNTSAGGSYSPWGTKAPSNFSGLFEVITDYVVLKDLHVISSQGIGIKIEGLGGDIVVGVRCYGCTTQQTYKNGIRAQFFDDLIVDGFDCTTAGFDAPWNRPVTTLNHPGATSFKNGLNCTVTNLVSRENYGEGIIIGDNQNGCDLHHCVFYGNMSPNLYLNNCENVDVHHNLVYGSSDDLFHADPSSGIYINCEYLLATDINRVTNVRIWNNLVCETSANFRIGQGELHGVTGQLPIYSGVEVYNNSFFEARGSSAKGVAIHTNVRVSGTAIKFQHNLIYQTLTPVSIGTCSTDPLIIHSPNSWYGTPSVSIQGPGDIYVNQLPVAPNAVILAGALNVANYHLSAGSPAKAAIASINAVVTDDYQGAARGAGPYTYGCFN